MSESYFRYTHALRLANLGKAPLVNMDLQNPCERLRVNRARLRDPFGGPQVKKMLNKSTCFDT